MTGLECPQCGSIRSRVYDKRNSSVGIRRRRECHDCGNRYSTVEVARVFRAPYKRRKSLAANLDDELSAMP